MPRCGGGTWGILPAEESGLSGMPLSASVTMLSRRCVGSSRILLVVSAAGNSGEMCLDDVWRWRTASSQVSDPNCTRMENSYFLIRCLKGNCYQHTKVHSELADKLLERLDRGSLLYLCCTCILYADLPVTSITETLFWTIYRF